MRYDAREESDDNPKSNFEKFIDEMMRWLVLTMLLFVGVGLLTLLFIGVENFIL